jgi:hypothetical protein
MISVPTFHVYSQSRSSWHKWRQPVTATLTDGQNRGRKDGLRNESGGGVCEQECGFGRHTRAALSPWVCGLRMERFEVRTLFIRLEAKQYVEIMGSWRDSFSPFYLPRDNGPKPTFTLQPVERVSGFGDLLVHMKCIASIGPRYRPRCSGTFKHRTPSRRDRGSDMSSGCFKAYVFSTPGHE